MTPETRERFAVRERAVIKAARAWRRETADPESKWTVRTAAEDALSHAIDELEAEHESYLDFMTARHTD